MRRVTSLSLRPSSPGASSSSSIDTSAKSRGARVAVPAKITSSMPPPRSDFGLDSPIAQRIASRRLDLPQPLGPTTPVRPPSILSSHASTKLLKPLSLSRRIRKFAPPRDPLAALAQRRPQLGLERVPGRGLLEHRAVDDEGRRALEVRILGGGVAGHLDQLIDRILVRQALAALGDRNPARRRPIREAGNLGQLDELPVRRQILHLLDLRRRHRLDRRDPGRLVLVQRA